MVSLLHSFVVPNFTIPNIAVLEWTRLVVLTAVVIQTLELLALRETFNERGIWRWSVLRGESVALSQQVAHWFDHILAYRPFIGLLCVRLCCALFAFWYPSFWVMTVLLATSILISFRWRGTFNGGSDYMTIVLLGALSVASISVSSSLFALGAIYYIALQSICSYFVAGVVKVRSQQWRNGRALLAFLSSGTYTLPEPVRVVLSHRSIATVCVWSIMLFELLFPLALFDPRLCLVFLISGAIFHFLNAWILGLNRFLLIWIATYPAILWCSVVASST